MAIIDASGLFNGDRLRRCSNAAQLHFARLFLASDGFARLEINYARIVGAAYPTFNPIPSEAELQTFIQEYFSNFLLFLYKFSGQLWGQWDTRPELLPRYKTALDRRSPRPPEPEFTDWKRSYREQHKSFPKSFGELSGGLRYGVGEGGGVEKANTCSPPGEQPGDQFSLDNPPVGTLDEPIAQPWGFPERKRLFQECFWPIWPRKVAKAAAEKAWLKHAVSRDVADRIVEALKAQLPQLTRDLKFCPYPATWLNDRRYEDDPAEASAAVNGTTHNISSEEPSYRDWQAWKEPTGNE